MQGGGPRPQGTTPSSSVFVGNLAFDATEEDVMNTFSGAGPIRSIRIGQDPVTGRMKGYGIVNYHSIDVADAAVRNLNGVELKGRNLRVSFGGEPGDGGGRGRGGGGGGGVPGKWQPPPAGGGYRPPMEYAPRGGAGGGRGMGPMQHGPGGMHGPGVGPGGGGPGPAGHPGGPGQIGGQQPWGGPQGPPPGFQGGPGPAGVPGGPGFQPMGAQPGVNAETPMMAPKSPQELSMNLPVGVATAQHTSQVMANVLGAPASAAAPSQRQTAAALAGMTPRQMYSILKDLRKQFEADPARCREVLAKNLHLTKGLFQAQIILGMLNPDAKEPLPDMAPAPQQPQQLQNGMPPANGAAPGPVQVIAAPGSNAVYIQPGPGMPMPQQPGMMPGGPPFQVLSPQPGGAPQFVPQPLQFVPQPQPGMPPQQQPQQQPQFVQQQGGPPMQFIQQQPQFIQHQPQAQPQLHPQPQPQPQMQPQLQPQPQPGGQQAPLQAGPAAAAIDPAQLEMLRRVMQLSPDQLANLTPEQKQQVEVLKQFAAQQGLI